jgi:hypothetical protein
MHLRKALLPLATAAALGASAAPAQAASITVGLGDQNIAMFDNPSFQALKLKRVRYFIPWNAMRNNAQRTVAENYVARAKAAKAKVFMHISTDSFRPKRAKLPSVAEYRREVGRLVKHFRSRGVTEWGVWNEANHDTQPTWDNPRRAASYFKVFYRWRSSSTCRRCTIVALDVLDQPGVERYIRRFNSALGSTYRRRATIVGIHNYSEVNRRYKTRTTSIVRTQRRSNARTKFWYTETGGVVSFGRSFKCSESRAKSRTKYMFDLARRNRAHITRLYAYQWTGTDCRTRFDAGLTRADGSVRPAYAEFRRGLSRTGFKR